MKEEVTATCIYDSKGMKLHSLYANTGGSIYNLTPIRESVGPKAYNSFKEMYETVLGNLKASGFKVCTWDEMGTILYNVQFIDINKPTEINRYGFAWDGTIESESEVYDR